MTRKEIILIGILFFLSAAIGASLGRVDFYGIIGESSKFNIVLILLSISAWYFMTIIVYLLSLKEKEAIIKKLIFSAFTFCAFFLLSRFQPAAALLSTILYFISLIYIKSSILKRHNLFARFVPNEIVIPVVKRAFLLLLIIMILGSLFQAGELLNQNALIRPAFLRTFIKPAVTVVNQQLTSQFNSYVGQTDIKVSGFENRQALVEFFLKQTLSGMSDGQVRQQFGVDKSQIPIERVMVTEKGDIDITDVAEGLLPGLTNNLNQKLKNYAPLIPIVILILTVLIFEAILWPFMILVNLITRPVFSLLEKLKLVTVVKETIEVERLRV